MGKIYDNIVQTVGHTPLVRLNKVTEGIDALGDVTIRIEKDGQSYVGRGSDTDIIVASAMAYMNALNRLLAIEQTQTADASSTA